MTVGYGDNVLERLFLRQLVFEFVFIKNTVSYIFSQKFRKVLIYDKTGLNKISFD